MRPLIALAAVLMLTGSAAALPLHQNKPPGNPPLKMSPSNLTKYECGQLGGDVISVSAKLCPSGQGCQTTGLDKKDHLVCLVKQ